MKRIIGTCGSCGGPVCVPSVWLGTTPPTPTCDRCGKVPREAHGPILPMQPPPHTRDYFNPVIFTGNPDSPRCKSTFKEAQ